MTQATQAAAMIGKARQAVFFGGAGVSTESGIPDFRSEKGLYAARQVYGRSPEELLSVHTLIREPELFFRYYKENLTAFHAKPNPAHLALAELERSGNLKAVITQNIDGLHQVAGSKCVVELHGSNLRHRCASCGLRHTWEYAMDAANCPGGNMPVCRACGGMVRPCVVLYGESLDTAALESAVSFLAAADLLIVGGTSLAVYPAAGLLDYYRGREIILINKSETPFDRRAALAVRQPIGEFLAEVMECMGAE